jgi:hypothetical protein
MRLMALPQPGRMLGVAPVIDGVFSPKSNGDLRFHRVNAPTSKELNALVATISERVARYLERQGWLAFR